MWHNHPFSQRNKAAKRAKKVVAGCVRQVAVLYSDKWNLLVGLSIGHLI